MSTRKRVSRSARPARPPRRAPRRRVSSLRSRPVMARRVSLPAQVGIVRRGDPGFSYSTAPTHERFGPGLRVGGTFNVCQVRADSDAAVNRIFLFNASSSTLMCGQLSSSNAYYAPGTSSGISDGRFPILNDSAISTRHIQAQANLFSQQAIRELTLEWCPTSTTQNNTAITFAVTAQEQELNCEENTFQTISSLARGFTTPAWAPTSFEVVKPVKMNVAATTLYDTVKNSTQQSVVSKHQFVVIGAVNALPVSSYTDLGYLRAHIVIDLYEVRGASQSTTNSVSCVVDTQETRAREIKTCVEKTLREFCPVPLTKDNYVMVPNSSSSASTSSASSSSTSSTSSKSFPSSLFR